ncbi:hypothetical protein FOZ63_021489, partial [Perkinsus olseni]
MSSNGPPMSSAREQRRKRREDLLELAASTRITDDDDEEEEFHSDLQEEELQPGQILGSIRVLSDQVQQLAAVIGSIQRQQDMSSAALQAAAASANPSDHVPSQVTAAAPSVLPSRNTARRDGQAADAPAPAEAGSVPTPPALPTSSPTTTPVGASPVQSSDSVSVNSTVVTQASAIRAPSDSFVPPAASASPCAVPAGLRSARVHFDDSVSGSPVSTHVDSSSGRPAESVSGPLPLGSAGAALAHSVYSVPGSPVTAPAGAAPGPPVPAPTGSAAVHSAPSDLPVHGHAGTNRANSLALMPVPPGPPNAGATRVNPADFVS